MEHKETILIKLSGEIFCPNKISAGSLPVVHSVVAQIAQLHKRFQLGIVMGGGNYFRGERQGSQLGLTPWPAHTIGMFATVMNGIALTNLLEQQHIPTVLFSAIDCSQAGNAITPQAIRSATEAKRVLVFAGGTGNPFFTTDTNAVLRAVQMGANTIWKAGPADGIYDSDPKINPSASKLKSVSYAEALESKLQIMDMSAFAMAADHNIQIRIFSIFENNALLHAAADQQFGSLIHV